MTKPHLGLTRKYSDLTNENGWYKADNEMVFFEWNMRHIMTRQSLTLPDMSGTNYSSLELLFLGLIDK